jgi:hypothetical protein
VIEHRRAELVKPSEGQLHFRLYPSHVRDARAHGLTSSVLEQGRLADARLAAEHQRGAPPIASQSQEPVELLTFGLPIEEANCGAREHFVIANLPELHPRGRKRRAPADGSLTSYAPRQLA